MSWGKRRGRGPCTDCPIAVTPGARHGFVILLDMRWTGRGKKNSWWVEPECGRRSGWKGSWATLWGPETELKLKINSLWGSGGKLIMSTKRNVS